jgi:hypothetical protein
MLVRKRRSSLRKGQAMQLGDAYRDLIDRYRYLDGDQKRRLIGTVALVVVTLLVGLVLSLRFCEKRADIAESRPTNVDTQAISQIREAMLSVSSRLTGENPESTVENAVQRAGSEKAAGMGASLVDKSQLSFNPNVKEWRDARGVAAGTALVVGPAPASFKTKNVVYIGVGRGGIPLEFTAGSEPAWLSKAVLGPKE